MIGSKLIIKNTKTGKTEEVSLEFGDQIIFTGNPNTTNPNPNNPNPNHNNR